MLEGKVAIVTGASRPNGMGLAAAKKLASLGASVLISDIAEPTRDLELDSRIGIGDATTLKKAEEALASIGGSVASTTCDVSKPDEVAACVERAVELFGGVDIVFNNAGVFVGTKPFLEISDRDWELCWSVNVRGCIEFCRNVIPLMKARGGGSIINNASLAGLEGYPEYSGYCTSKFAIVGLTKALAAEFGADGVRVNAICPGDIATDISKGERALTGERMGLEAADYHDEAVSRIAMRRQGQAMEVAEVVAFLASPAASYVTGVAMPVAGGLPAGA